MKKFLNPKILIPAVIGIVLVGAVLYILLAPETWWKPFYVQVELDETPSPETPVAGTQGDVSAQIPVTDVNSPQGSRIGFLQGGQPQGVMYELDKKVVNLAEPGGLRYLQASIVLELWPLIENYYQLSDDERVLAEEEFQQTIDTQRPVIDDIVTTILSSKTFNEITTIEGKQALKEELMGRINEALGYQGVINVYFTDFVIQ